MQRGEPTVPNPASLKGGNRAFSQLRTVRLSIGSFFLLLIVGWYGFTAVANEMKINLESQLENTLRANVKAIRHWAERELGIVQFWANEPATRQAILSLVQRNESGSPSQSDLQHSPELPALRVQLERVVQKNGYIGFVVFDRKGLQVAALLEAPVGAKEIIKRSDFVQRSLEGKTVFSLPFPGEVPLPALDGAWKKNWPTMFFSTPVYDDNGIVAAVLAFRHRPEEELVSVLKESRSGRTEESYAFDKNGLMISDSRFNDQLRKMGIIPDTPDSRAILTVSVREPRFYKNIPRSIGKKLDPAQMPLTRMAQSAVQGHSGMDVEGYLDYRGIKVVGAWTWLPEYGFGLCTEIDTSEAYAPLNELMRVFLVLYVLFAGVLGIALLLRQQRYRLEISQRSAIDALAESEKKIRAVFEHALDGIITIFDDGSVESFNPSAEKLFGYTRDEVVGKNISMLMPEPQRSLHDGYMQRYLFTGETRVLGVAREVVAQRKNGSLVDIEISVSQMPMTDKVRFIGIVRDVSARKKAEREIEQLNLRNESILHSAGEGIFGINLEGRITFINPAGAALLGYPGADLVGERITHILFKSIESPGSNMVRNHPIFRALDQRVTFRIANEYFWTKSREGFPVEYTCSTLEERGEITGVVVVFTNITERFKAEATLKHYAAELERSNRELEEFAFIASHDLQEPLRKVVIFGDRIKIGIIENETDRTLDFIDRLQNSIIRMQRFIDDLLHFSRVTRRSRVLAKVDLNEVVKEVISNLEIQLKETRGNLIIEPLPTLEGDRFQLQQLFQNIISNALKFRKEGEFPVVKIRSHPNGYQRWVIEIEDNGIGFDPKYAERIFRPFERLHSSEQYKGSGIGLAICQKVISQHGGSIKVASSPNEGTTFSIHLPSVQPRHSPSNP